MTATSPPAAHATGLRRLSPDQIARYQQDGFVRVAGVLSAQEVERFRSAAEAVFADRSRQPIPAGRYFQVFTQVVNAWRENEVLRELTFHPTLADLAQQLAGIPLRLWHDHLLVKAPHNNAATEFHQDRPYWPHATSRHSLSAWIALVDVPPSVAA